MFEEVIKRLPLDTNPMTEYLSMDSLNVDAIKDKLFNLDKVSDEEIYHLIRKNYSYILDESFLCKNIELINSLFTNSKFLITLANVLSRPEIQLSFIQKILCNRLAYDYFTARVEKDNYIRSLMVNLVKVVNREIMPSLIGLGLPEELCAYIVNARYSTQKEDIQVKRVNLVVMQQPSDVMTVQMIVNIYGKLYNRITPLFSGIMYDSWNKDLFINNPEMEDVYATINVSLLEIVNNLPQDIMYHLLKNFNETYQLIHLGEKIRFNIYSFCKDDYPRLHSTLEYLQKMERITLPMS